MQWKNIIAILAMVLLVGCGGETPESTQNNSVAAISYVNVDNSLEVSPRRVVNVAVQIESDVEVKQVPLTYYLVSTEMELSEKSIDKNTTQKMRIPVRQYYIGTQFVDLNSQDIGKELNITLPNKVEEGQYKVAVFIDLEKTKKLTMPDNTFIFESQIPIDVPKVVNDVELVSLSFDNDDNVMIVKNNNADTILSMTADVQSNGENIKGCYLQATLILNGQRIPLEFLGDELKDPSKFDLSELSLVKKHVSLEIKISKKLKKDLLTSLGDKVYNAQIEVTLVSDLENESIKNNTKDISLFVYKKVSTNINNEPTPVKNILLKSLSKTSIEAIPMEEESSLNGNVLLKSFSTNFSADKKDNDFGIGLNENADAHFSTLDSGVSSRADLNARLLGHDYTILGLDIGGFVQYDSFENTGYSIVLKVFGANIFTKYNDMASMAQRVPKATLTDEEKATLTVKEQKKLLIKKQIKINADSDNRDSVLEYVKDFSIFRSLSITAVIPVSIMNVDVTAGLEGEIGFHNAITLDGILSLHANSGPKASLSGFASGGIGVAGYEAGVRGTYTFISNYFQGESKFKFVFSGNEQNLKLEGILSQKVTNTFEGPKGTLDVYLKKTTLGKCFAGYADFCMIPTLWGCGLYVKEELWVPCDIVESENTINIFSWDSKKSSNVTLLNESITLSDNKIF